jgi:hypothetical protein
MLVYRGPNNEWETTPKLPTIEVRLLDFQDFYGALRRVDTAFRLTDGVSVHQLHAKR